jgi:hypothetical protein
LGKRKGKRPGQTQYVLECFPESLPPDLALVDIPIAVAHDPSTLGDWQAEHLVGFFKGLSPIIGPVNEDNLLVFLLYPAWTAFAIAAYLFPERTTFNLRVSGVLMNVIDWNCM